MTEHVLLITVLDSVDPCSMITFTLTGPAGRGLMDERHGLKSFLT